ncbi:MAG: hypothetical protein D6730_05810 [Bacteroidetes bacterium]|nr:MAG: hypothetical protein D6730_05810 [Bacteroidota bacterium]
MKKFLLLFACLISTYCFTIAQTNCTSAITDNLLWRGMVLEDGVFLWNFAIGKDSINIHELAPNRFFISDFSAGYMEAVDSALNQQAATAENLGAELVDSCGLVMLLQRTYPLGCGSNKINGVSGQFYPEKDSLVLSWEFSGCGIVKVAFVPHGELVFDPVSGLQAFTLGRSSVLISWTSPANQPDSLILERQQEGGDFQPVAAVPLQYNYYIDEGLTANSAYTYRLVSFYEQTSVVSDTIGAKAEPKFFEPLTDGAIIEEPPVRAYGGVWADYDLDGDEDLYIPTSIDANRNYVPNLFYANNGDGSFSKMEEEAITRAPARSTGAIWLDLNNDGRLDLHVFRSAVAEGDSIGIGDMLYLNTETGFEALPFEELFLNTPNETGLPPDRIASEGASWADFDGDGDLDLLHTSLRFYTAVFQNNGDLSFTLMDTLEISSGSEHPQWVDYDGDGDQDIMFTSTNFPGSARLFQNDGLGNFTEVSQLINQDQVTPGRYSWVDFDNDGDLDCVLEAVNRNRTWFYFNNGNGTFTPMTDEMLAGTRMDGRFSVWGDIDNDGYEDLLTVSSAGTGSRLHVFLNKRDGTFMEVLEKDQFFHNPADSILGESSWFYFGSLSDVNQDGYLDLLLSGSHPNAPIRNRLFLNNGPENVYFRTGRRSTPNNWLKISLKNQDAAQPGNLWGIGARVKVKANGFWQMREIHSMSGAGEAHGLISHFGLASAMQADSVLVLWPGGDTTILTNIAANQHLPIEKTSVNIQQAQEEVFRLFPNPFSARLKLAGFSEGPLTICIQNIWGQSLWKKTYPYIRDEVSLNLEHFSPGIYWLGIYDKRQGLQSMQQIIKLE